MKPYEYNFIAIEMFVKSASPNDRYINREFRIFYTRFFLGHPSPCLMDSFPSTKPQPILLTKCPNQPICTLTVSIIQQIDILTSIDKIRVRIKFGNIFNCAPVQPTATLVKSRPSGFLNGCSVNINDKLKATQVL